MKGGLFGFGRKKENTKKLKEKKDELIKKFNTLFYNKNNKNKKKKIMEPLIAKLKNNTLTNEQIKSTTVVLEPLLDDKEKEVLSIIDKQKKELIRRFNNLKNSEFKGDQTASAIKKEFMKEKSDMTIERTLDLINKLDDILTNAEEKNIKENINSPKLANAIKLGRRKQQSQQLNSSGSGVIYSSVISTQPTSSVNNGNPEVETYASLNFGNGRIQAEEPNPYVDPTTLIPINSSKTNNNNNLYANPQFYNPTHINNGSGK